MMPFHLGGTFVYVSLGIRSLFFMENKLYFVIQTTGGSNSSHFTANSLPKDPVGFKQNPNFLANPIQQY